MTIRVHAGFGDEFPGADASSAEAAANLVAAANAFLEEVHRRRHPVAGLSHSAYQVLAILDGAGQPLPSHVIAERLLVTTASMSSLLDTLERRGFVRRLPHPEDRRKILVEITDPAREVVDQVLPLVHAAATEAFAVLEPSERELLTEALGRVRARLSDIRSEEPRAPEPRRRPVP